MSKVWKSALADAAGAKALAAEAGLPLPLASLLVSRGVATAQAADRFLNPRLSDLSDPFLLPDMGAAVARIWKAIDAREPIVVFGDYDADGVSSTALMVHVLSRLGAVATPFLPHRIDDGYGLGAEPLGRCIDQFKPKLVITVDCGTGSVDAAQLAKEKGIDLIVTDHHEKSGAVAPALAVVNPKLGHDEGQKVLAGVGVAFKLCHALVKRAREEKREGAEAVDLRPFLDLVGIGTVADIVPLVGENRILARHGLTALMKTRLVGLQELIDVSGLRDKPLDAYHIGFVLGPRLNAAGRVGDAHAALEMLLMDDRAGARGLAMQLDAANRERQETEARIVKEAMTTIGGYFEAKQPFGLVVHSAGWHPGVIGIVASRLSSKYRRPTVVIAVDETGLGRGSCRSIEGFNLVERLEDCGDLLRRFGGHAMAAGLEVEGSKLAAFCERFNEVATRALAGSDLRPVQTVDAWVDLREADEPLIASLQRMQPFGFGNPTPVLAARGVRVVSTRPVGNGKHLKMTVASGATQRDAIGFHLGEQKVPDGPVDVAFHLQTNTFNGRTSIQLNVQDIRASQPEG